MLLKLFHWNFAACLHVEIGGCLIAPRPYLKQTHTDQTPGSPMVPFFGVSLAIFGANKVGEKVRKLLHGASCFHVLC